MPELPHAFVRDFVSALFEHHFVSGIISHDEYHEIRATFVGSTGERLAEELFAKSPAPVAMLGGRQLRLVYLREMDGSEFPFILGLP